jgi:hypothetical protein
VIDLVKYAHGADQLTGLARSGRQLLQEHLRLLQITRVKPFRKPPVNRSQQFARLLHLALVAPEASRREVALASWPIRHFPLASYLGLIETVKVAWWRTDHAKARGWLLLR